MPFSTHTPKKVAQRRERLRRDLERLGLRPREAEARASIEQTHLSDYRRRGGVGV